MDYEALSNILSRPAATWTECQVVKWLQFVHLDTLIQSFSANKINGPSLLNLNTSQMNILGATNSIIQRKLMRWIKEGFAEFEDYLTKSNLENKENIPPLQQKKTTQREILKSRPQKSFNSKDEEMVIRSCDGNIAAFYVMKQKTLKIGRSNVNTIRSLEVSVEDQHAEIFRLHNKYFIRDNGTEAGTFIKVTHPKPLHLGIFIQIGSFLVEVIAMDKEMKTITLGITHMISKGFCEIVIVLQDGCSTYNFGRRKTNNFSCDDEHLSGIHARIFMLRGEFVIEDLHSTNGTWLRLSPSSQPSASFLLEEGCIFKIGTTITYQCEGNKQSEQKMQIQYDDTCSSCNIQKKNILLLPCRHNVVCSGCGEGLIVCPMCQLPIQEQIKIYI